MRTATGILKVLAVILLSNAVLYPSALSQVGDLGPVFIWICKAAKGATSAVSGDMPRRYSSRVVVAVSRHDSRSLAKCNYI